MFRTAQVLAVPRAIRLSAIARSTNPNGDPAAPAVKLPKLRLHLHAPRGTGQRRGEAGYKGPAASPHRRTATPGARGQSGIGTRALALCAVKDNERGHRHQKRGTVSNSIRGNINAPAPNPLGGSEAAQEGGRLRPAQPALSQDDQDLIEASRPSRRLGPTSACSPQPRPRILPGFYPARPSGGLLLPSTGGLILDSAPASFAVITTGKVHDVTVAKTLKLQPGTIIVDDRGYNDYGLFGCWTDEGVYFVTRLKDNAVYRVVKNLPVPLASNSNVRKDQVIRFRGPQAKQRCPHELRLVSFYDEEQKREFQFLTNNFRLAATTIAAIYKDRWAVELFFKALKQNLKIKTFVGTSPTAVKTQVWTALITMLLLRFMQLKSQWGWSMSNLVALLRMNLFTHRDLWAWLDNPFAEPPDTPGPEQVAMAF